MDAVVPPGPPAAALEVDPFTSLAVHFGMLLGVSDFQVLTANPRGKAALHQAWHHGKGVVWGYPVRVTKGSPELLVGPGLCVDGLGRDVSSGGDQCLDVRTWLDEHVTAHTVTPVQDGSTWTFDAHLVVRHDACLTRPVPTVGPTCGTGADATGYSRVLETARLELRPGRCGPPDDRDAVFAELRALVRDGTLPTDIPRGRDRLADFRTVLAMVASRLGPPGLLPPRPAQGTRLFPEDEPGEVLLADLPGLRLHRLAVGWELEAPVVDLSVRRTHVPTWLTAELVAELLDGGSRGGSGCPGDAGGPRVERISPPRDDGTVTLTFEGTVVEPTLRQGLELYRFDPTTGWSEQVPLEPVLTEEQAGSVVVLELPSVPSTTDVYRLMVRGTGPTPVVGLVGGLPVPLAGWVGDPPGTRAQGHDVVRRFPDRGGQP